MSSISAITRVTAVPVSTFGRIAPPLAAAAADLLAWLLQVPGRAPLLWDEAVRVRAGLDFARFLSALDLASVVSWFNAQVFYPPIVPLADGIALLITKDARASAYLPSLLAFGVAGLLVRRLGAELGLRPAAAWAAALLAWTTPILVRLAGSGLTEPIGADVCLGFSILAIRVLRSGERRDGYGLGAIVAGTFLLKYDYSFVLLATIAILVPLALAQRRSIDTLVLALRTAVVVIGIVILLNPVDRLQGAFAFVYQAVPGSAAPASWATHGVDFAYYPTILFGTEIGLWLPVAVLGIAAVAVAIIRRLRTDVAPPVVLIVVWYVAYSISSVKAARYAAVVLPLLTTLAVWLATSAWAGVARRRRMANTSLLRRVDAPMAVFLLATALGIQAFGPGGVTERLGYLRPNASVDGALRLIVDNIAESAKEPVLVIGESNALMNASIDVEFALRHDLHRKTIYLMPESPPGSRAAMLQSALTTLRSSPPCQVVGVDVVHGGAFDDSDWRRNHPSQPAYFLAAERAAADAELTLRAARDFDDLTVRVWDCVP